MSEYLYLFRGGDPANQNFSEEQRQAHMQKWGAWMQKLTETGHFKGGNPLAQGATMLSGASGETVTDGPFSDSNEVIGGYIIVKSESREEAIELAKGCPIYENGGKVELREIIEM